MAYSVSREALMLAARDKDTNAKYGKQKGNIPDSGPGVPEDPSICKLIIL